MKKAHGYTADDGTWFGTKAEARRHDELSDIKRICGLGEGEVVAATTRTNIHLADTFERIGNLIANQRRKSGDLRRGKSIRVAPPVPAAAE